jgi:hypothetical protein
MKSLQRRMMWVAVVGVMVFRQASATTFYVKPTGNDANNGTTWALAKKTIQSGLTMASDGDTVLVTNGVYTVTSTVDITNHIVRSVNGAAVTTINGGGGVRCVYLRPGSVLDGFTVTNGNDLTSIEGGAYAWSAKVRNCTIRGNSATVKAGGAYIPTDFMAPKGGTMENCTIVGNTVPSCGGAYVMAGAVLRNCISYYNQNGERRCGWRRARGDILASDKRGYGDVVPGRQRGADGQPRDVQRARAQRLDDAWRQRGASDDHGERARAVISNGWIRVCLANFPTT